LHAGEQLQWLYLMIVMFRQVVNPRLTTSITFFLIEPSVYNTDPVEEVHDVIVVGQLQ